MDDQQIEFVERMGRHMEADGLPRIGGRIYGFLLLQQDPCSLDDMTGALSVSKTSVSTNARLLEQRGLVERVTKPGDRKDYYVAAPDQTRTLELAVHRVREMSGLLRLGAEAAPRSAPLARRFQKMLAFNEDGLRVLEELLDGWRKTPR